MDASWVHVQKDTSLFPDHAECQVALVRRVALVRQVVLDLQALLDQGEQREWQGPLEQD